MDRKDLAALQPIIMDECQYALHNIKILIMIGFVWKPRVTGKDNFLHINVRRKIRNTLMERNSIL